ncbi:polysaccharide deacetylase family protein [Sulfuricurvum sp.]|uniref:polysaccharide deacetylase family protein n=1 Tax=Sulfuricurvum sp. TaxID=2025608 RepID=UPI003BB5769F
MTTTITIDYEFDWGGRVKESKAIDQVTLPLLETLQKVDAKATFFVSAETVAKTLPMLRTIVEAGHEIASHGFHHDLKYDTLSRDELHLEIRSSKETLEDALGVKVVGFRTPQFRKNRYTEEVLSELEFLYDSSSVNTSLQGRYQERQHEFGLIPEIPVSTIYGRFPAGIKWINLIGTKFDPSPIRVIYVHPFDLLNLSDTLRSYSSKISPLVLAFYLARIGSPLNTIAKVARNSHTLHSLISK